ncbi:MAG: IS1595 family transposase [Alphaproteobacteria bacterium]|nr:IS1595 family transposase [Alphaproteobacteria bacterium]
MFDLTNPIFSDDNKARKYLESLRWENGRFCPYCGEAERTSKVGGRAGYYRCLSCKKQFTVRVGTIFERSHIPLHKWVAAFYLMASSKKGISAHQLHRMLGITYKSAWFMAHRIREAMRPGSDFGPMGGEGKTVEADETYVGGKLANMHRDKRKAVSAGGSWGKEMVFSLVERGGSVRSVHTPSVNAATLRPILIAQVDRASLLVTDDAGQYRHMKRDFNHEVVNHSAGEYVRGEAHTTTIEGYFSILKRGVTGTYHHVSQQHLKRYLAEFDFRYNERAGLKVDDTMRAEKAIKGAEGKRLTYQQPHA